MTSLIYLIISSLFISVLAFRRQSVGIKGVLMCGDGPSTGTTIKLWDKDTGPDPDDLMAMGTTGSDGRFNLSGSETELTNIDPRFKVYHDCDNILPCQRKAMFTIPDSYIVDGDVGAITKFFDLGVINLETRFMDDEHKCF